MSDVENGNVTEVSTNSKHGSLSTLNMEWDNQGLILFSCRIYFVIKYKFSDCFKDEDIKEKIFQEQNRLNRNKFAKESLY